MNLAPPSLRGTRISFIPSTAVLVFVLLMPGIPAAPFLFLSVLTGYVGQISLAQMSFAGMGAYFCSRVASDLHIAFPFSIIAAALAVVPFGVLLGLPALRVRGVNLAVVTLGAAVAINALLFTDADTVHLPGSLARALAEAKREGADLLSY